MLTQITINTGQNNVQNISPYRTSLTASHTTLFQQMALLSVVALTFRQGMPGAQIINGWE